MPREDSPRSTRSAAGTLLPVLAAVALVVTASLVPALSVDEVPVQHDVTEGFGDGNGPGSGDGSSAPPGTDGPPGGDGRDSREAGYENSTDATGKADRPRLDDGGGRVLAPPPATDVGENMSEAFKDTNATTVMTVRSDRPAYWRAGVYDVYTGTGWNRSPAAGEATPYDGPLAEGERTFQQVVTLEQPSLTLPTAWRPRTVSDNVGDDAVVTDGGALRSESVVPAGTSYIVTSVPQERDPATLRGAGTDYPTAVERRYTALPDSVPDRLAVKTDRVTADATTPYGTATAIEAWLESTKEYDIDASYAGPNVASEFVFEMERGYCELFATSMVAMLRTQGIPARYVVGFSSGEKVGENTYEVRAMHAHAWVEVYFPDVGWVKFDPTPGSDRLTEEADAISDQLGTAPGAYDHAENGSPDEQFDQNGSVPRIGEEGENTTGEDGDTTDQDGNSTDDGDTTSQDGDDTQQQDGDDTQQQDGNSTDDGDTTQQQDGDTTQRQDDQQTQQEAGEPPPMNVSVEGDVVPGNEVVVVTTRAGEPVPGALVLFDDEPVGRTNASGRLTVAVPYVSELEITAEDPLAGGSGGAAGTAAPAATRPPPNGSTYDLPTTITLSAAGGGDLTPGSEATLTAAIEGVPVAGARVTVDGSYVGRTDAEGRINVSVGWRDASVTVAAERGETGGSETFAVATTADLTVTNAVPGRTAAGVATVDGRAVPDAAVYVDGELVGRTDANGQFSFAVPYEAAVNVSVRRGAVEGETRVGLPTAANVSVVGPTVPGAPVTVVAALEGDRVPGAVVRVDGERVGTTDDRGVLEVTMPFSDPATFAVQRGAVAGNATADPPPLNASVAPGVVPVLAAGLPATVRVGVGGTPVEGATATVGGAESATGSDGAATLSLPLAADATVTVERGDLSTTASVDGLWAPWIRLAGVALLAGAAVVAVRRYGDAMRAALAAGRHLVVRVAHLTAAVLVALAGRLEPLVREVVRGFRAVAAFAGERVAAVLAALPAPGGLRTWLRKRGRWARAYLRNRLRAIRGGEVDVEAAAAAAEAPDTADRRLTVRRAWQAMLAEAGLRRREHRTPGELARSAVDRGYPADAVGTLTDAFREVEYGRYEPSGGRLDRARRALERIRSFGADDGGGGQ
jgi:transglutaminase-like putative cysteine protease